MQVVHTALFWRFLLLLLVLAPTGMLPGNDTPTGVVKLTEDEKAKLVASFNASSATFTEDGKMELTYNFEDKDDSLLEDWFPHPSKTKNRVRWSQGYEGTYRTVEDGLVIADKGTWLHKALWSDDVKIEIDYLSMSASRKGDLLTAAFVYDKGRRAVGSNGGSQCVRLKGLSHSGRPIPERASSVNAEQRFTFGMSVKDGVVTSLRSGRAMADSSTKKKFMKKAGSGHPGLLWRGMINGFIFKVTITGELDSKWVQLKLGKDKDSSTKSK